MDTTLVCAVDWVNRINVDYTYTNVIRSKLRSVKTLQ